MKIIILPDGLEWIVDRNCREVVNNLKDIEFTVIPYTKISVKDFIEQANKHDLVHYFNWDIRRFADALPHIKKPLLISVLSHRYNKFINKIKDRPNTWFHVINPDLLYDFPNSEYIPEGIFSQFKPDHEFTVGFAGYKDVRTHDYKGVYLIKRACENLGVKFKPALGDVHPDKMPDYYRSIDLYVCASEAEGFSTAVMECMAMNVPVITVNTGVPRQYGITKIERSVEGIEQGIKAFYTQDQVKEYSWSNISLKYKKLYGEILNSK